MRFAPWPGKAVPFQTHAMLFHCAGRLSALYFGERLSGVIIGKASHIFGKRENLVDQSVAQ